MVQRRADADVAAASADGENGTVVRRAPFSDNPQVGVRGQRTQQRILDAALRVFGEAGYHQCSIDAITRHAGCSRVSFYQYFSSKEDVFRQLGMQVARQLNASTDRLDPVTADGAGWQAMREWVGRYAEIYDRYRPVFRAYPAAEESDTALAGDSRRAAHRYVAGIQSRVVGTTLSPRELDEVVELLRETLARMLDDVTTLRFASPSAYPDDVVLDAYTDVVHRTLFGLRRDVNVHEHRVRRPPKLAMGPIMRDASERDQRAELEPPRGGRVLAALLDAARDVFVSRGYHGTRVDDVVEAAGVSHGAFYRYFKNKDDLAHLLAAEAMRTLSKTFGEIPDVGDDGATGRAALRRWLRRYNRAQLSEAAMIRVWADAALQDDSLLEDSAAVLDWGRRRMAQFLGGRDFGDVDIDAVVLLALVDTFGVRERAARTADAAVTIIERGFLGR